MNKLLRKYFSIFLLFTDARANLRHRTSDTNVNLVEKDSGIGKGTPGKISHPIIRGLKRRKQKKQEKRQGGSSPKGSRSGSNDHGGSTTQPDEASSIFSLGNPTFHGSGCPEGTVDVVPSDDGQTVSVLFSAYGASTDSDTTRERVSCNLAVPVDIEPGISLGIYKVDYRGYAYVPDTTGSSAKFSAEYFFAGSKGPELEETYEPGFDDDIFLSDEVGAVVWSNCGDTTNFRINSAVTAQKGQSDDEDVDIQLDTIDIEVGSAFRYYIKHKGC